MVTLHKKIFQPEVEGRLGAVRVVDLSWVMAGNMLSGSPGQLRHMTPGLGEHTHVVLQSMGCSDKNLAHLSADGVI